MALASKMSATRRIGDRRKAEQPTAPQKFRRSAAQRGATHPAGAVARPANDLSCDGGRSLDRTEAQRALDERLSEHLDAIVNATFGISREQREIDRREAGAWRRFLWSLSGRRW
jgi:hypothetical protein